MASVIKTRTISLATETAIQLSNSQFARTLSIGSAWTTIRVGLRLHMDTTGGNLPGVPILFFGLCSGTTDIFGDASVTHCVGAISDDTWLVAGNVYYASSMLKPACKYGTTLTKGTSFGQSAIPSTITAASRVCWFVDITKGSPNFSLKVFTQHTATIADISVATFLQQMEAATPALAQHQYIGPQTVAVDEATYGYFDSVNVAWNQTTPVVEICDLAVARLA
jgi:hypothetical protein